jgi:hypothetical protein
LIPTAGRAIPFDRDKYSLIIGKSPLAPLYQRGGLSLPLAKGGGEGFYNECLFISNLISKYGKGMI